MSRPTVAGYELEYRLGAGASSTVWRARQKSSLGRPVAVKRVPTVDGLPGEAAVLVALDHPHIVRVFEVVPDGDGVAVAMQLASGGSLDERMARRGPLLAAEVADVATKLASALASAHRHGVLHRDVKPANVLFTSDGEPLLADFGIAVWRDGDDPMIRGTDGYLDPRIRQGAPPDPAADVYALATMALEMLGEAPATPDAADDALRAVLQQARAPEGFASADEFLAALTSRFGQDQSAIALSSCPKREGATRTFGPRPPRPAPGQPARSWTVPAAIVGFVLFVAGAWLALRPGSPPTPVRHRATPLPAAVCPSVVRGPGVVVGDVDGDGCPEALVVVGNVIDRGGVRFAVGEPGDQVVVGDWDCDGLATPAAFRPGDQRAYLFDGWAAHDQPAPAVRSVAATVPPVAACED